jgi:hypothetical protein
MKPHRALALGLPFILALCLYQGCSAQESAVNGGTAAAAATGQGGGAAHGATGGVGGTGASAAAGGAAAAGGGGAQQDGGPPPDFDADFHYDAPPYDATLNQDSACAGDTVEASPVPLDIYLMLDRTGSMGQTCNVSWPGNPTAASKWCYAINAIAGYIQDPGSNGNRMAIRLFATNLNNGQCNGAGFSTPAVGLVDLTAQAQQIITAMNNKTPNGTTPTEGALRGIAAYTASIQTPGRVTIGILVTDGEPTDCNQSDSALATIVANHFANTGIHIFMIGMTGASFNRLETWANYPGAISHDDTNDACGNGNGPCHHYNVGDGDPAVFIWALQQIQNAVLGCTYNVPAPSDGGVLDPNAVIIEYQPGGQPPGQQLDRVTDASGCANNPNGWYYNDNNNPTTIQLCSGVCATVQADPNAKVNILLGCQGS